MTTHYFTHRDCLFHDNGEGHPEKADRLRMVWHRIENEEFESLEHHEASKATRELLELAHTSQYLDEIETLFPKSGIVQLDPDTFMSPGTKDAALRSAGAVKDAVDVVMTRQDTNAFCAIRPPGHHAEADRAMGFCIYNNVAIGALYAQKAYKLNRIAVIDFDVHHGNGTQTIFENDPGLFYGSTHQEAPFYPGTGHAFEIGKGNIVNVPLPAGAGSSEFRSAISTEILPKLIEFNPELIIVSAGFDAHHRDTRADMNLVEEDYRWVTSELLKVAAKCCENRLVSVMEGGYDLIGLAESAETHVKALLGK